MARYWGFWTGGKLDLLRRYLNAFTTASKQQGGSSTSTYGFPYQRALHGYRESM